LAQHRRAAAAAAAAAAGAAAAAQVSVTVDEATTLCCCGYSRSIHRHKKSTSRQVSSPTTKYRVGQKSKLLYYDVYFNG